jgi:hypothetical protein
LSETYFYTIGDLTYQPPFIVKKDHVWILMKIFQSKLKGRRKKEKPTMRGMDDAEKDLWEMKNTRW